MMREATLADVPQLVAMGRQFLASSRYATVLADNADAMTACATALITGAHGVVWVTADDAGVLSGMIGLAVYPHPISGERTCGELFWWVNVESRGNGVRLLRRAETWARDQGAVKLQMIAPSDEVGALYARLGYRVIETGWQKELAA